MKHFVLILLGLASMGFVVASEAQHFGGMRAYVGVEAFGQFKHELSIAHQVHKKMLEVSPGGSHHRSDFLFVLDKVRRGNLGVDEITPEMCQADFED